MTSGTRRTVGEHTIEVARPDKVLFPDDGITKLNLVDHYARMAEVMLPYVQHRPLTLQRFPDGIGESGFYEKKAPAHLPAWIRRVRVDTAGGSQEQVSCDDRATLAQLAEQACLTPHMWLSTVDHLDRPDQIVFDLDPSAPGVAKVQHAAHAVGALLDELGLTSYVKTTGSRGFHVHVPLRVGPDFDRVRAFAREVAHAAVERDPGRLTIEQRKRRRGDRVFVDVLRNGYGQTTVPPYAIRARAGAPVATPLSWSEVGSTAPDRYRMSSVRRRLGQRTDPWRGFARHRQVLETAMDRLESL